MKVLVVGGGGREHAIVWKLAQSPKVDELLCAPGNGGIAQLARCFDIKATDLDGQCKLALDEKVDFVVVAPDDPLSLGLVDRLTALGIPAFGPTANAAVIEASKVFSKNLMKKIQYSNREIRNLYRHECRACICPEGRRADRRQVRRACARQGRYCLPNARGGRGRCPFDDGGWSVR